MQSTDQLGSLDVGRVLVAERPALHAKNEAERLDIAGQIGEQEGGDLAFVEVVEFESLEVANQNVAGTLVLRQRVEIFPSLS